MPFTVHPDLWGHSLVAYFFAYEGKLNPYETLVNLPPAHPVVKNFGINDIFIYPPLTYFTLGFFRLLIKPFVDPGFIIFLMESPANIFGRGDLFLNLFLYKLPYLFVDIGLGFLLANFFDDLKKKKLAFMLWMINPISLYATFMIGQIDILPTFFTVLAVFLALKKKFYLSMLCLGIGAGFKLYPFLLVIPTALMLGDAIKKRIKLVALGVLPFFLTIIPFVNSSAFRYMVFSPKSEKMLFMNWPVSGAEGIYPFVLILFLIYFFAYFKKVNQSLPVYFLAVLLLIFSVTHYHPQWFLWVSPFLIWELTQNNFKNWLLVGTFFASWLMITLFFESSLTIGLFSPVIPDLGSVGNLADFVSKYLNVFQLKSVIRSIFAAASLFYVYKLFTQEKMVK